MANKPNPAPTNPRISEIMETKQPKTISHAVYVTAVFVMAITGIFSVFVGVMMATDWWFPEGARLHSDTITSFSVWLKALPLSIPAILFASALYINRHTSFVVAVTLLALAMEVPSFQWLAFGGPSKEMELMSFFQGAIKIAIALLVLIVAVITIPKKSQSSIEREGR